MRHCYIASELSISWYFCPIPTIFGRFVLGTRLRPAQKLVNADKRDEKIELFFCNKRPCFFSGQAAAICIEELISHFDFNKKRGFAFLFVFPASLSVLWMVVAKALPCFFFCENMLFRRRGMCFVPHRLYALWYVCIANDRVPFFSLFAVFFLCSSLLGRVYYLWTVRDHDTLFLPMCFLFWLGVCSPCALPFATGGEIAYEASRQVGHVWFPGSSQLLFPALTL